MIIISLYSIKQGEDLVTAFGLASVMVLLILAIESLTKTNANLIASFIYNNINLALSTEGKIRDVIEKEVFVDEIRIHCFICCESDSADIMLEEGEIITSLKSKRLLQYAKQVFEDNMRLVISLPKKSHPKGECLVFQK
jgi:hypothetical protein